MAMAIRIARASTGRDKVAFCGYHGWHDWYLAANLTENHALDGQLLPGLLPTGTPLALRDTVFPFHYNNIGELYNIVCAHGEIAAIVMEPARNEGPIPGFLEDVRRIATRCGAVFMLDEVTSAWRMNTGGVHLTYNVQPDIAVFAKGMANGYPMAAVIGTRAVMEAAQESFISSTFWTEKIGPAAALATIKKHKDKRVSHHLIEVGTRVQAAWLGAAEQAALPIEVGGIPPLSHFAFKVKEQALLLTLFIQEMLGRGFLASGQFYASYAHEELHIAAYVSAVREVFQLVAQARSCGDIEQRLRGPVKQTGFHRLN
jgi:glutamate-1-semialdehyde 2,1-aminomutase